MKEPTNSPPISETEYKSNIISTSQYVEKVNDEVGKLSIENIPSPKENKDLVNFKCDICTMEIMVDYFGYTPPFINGLRFREPTYVLKDPYEKPPPRWKPADATEYFVSIGSLCHICAKMVCQDIDCSFFYTHTYCLPCAEKAAATFPEEIQQKLRKYR